MMCKLKRVEYLTHLVATITVEKNKFEQLHVRCTPYIQKKIRSRRAQRRSCQQVEERHSTLEKECSRLREENSAQQQVEARSFTCIGKTKLIACVLVGTQIQ